jgi:hypothetical protein
MTESSGDSHKGQRVQEALEADFGRLFAHASMLVIAEAERVGTILGTEEHFERTLSMVGHELKPRYGLSDSDLLELLKHYLDRGPQA